MKNKTKNEKSLSGKILDYIGQTSKDIFIASAKIMFDPVGLAKELGLYGMLSSPHYCSREISNLRRNSYFRREGKKYYLTEKGRIKIIKDILKSRSAKNHKWNGFWLCIIFDIPEANRRERSFLRRELKHIGCRELQKSVWITPLEIENELIALLNLWKKDFNGDIRFLRINKITGEEDLKKTFRIA
jgi:hypothetical protein